MAEKHKCVGRVRSQYHTYTCGKNATLEHAGNWWCKNHHPPTVEVKNKTKAASWQAKWDAERAAAKTAETSRKLGELALEYMREQYPAFVAEWEKNLNG